MQYEIMKPETQACLTTVKIQMIIIKLRAWFNLARVPFYIVAILPFILGTVLAWRLTGQLDWSVLGLGMLAMVFILLATHFSAEYFDYETDTLVRFDRNRFTGGSQVLQSGLIPRRQALKAAIICLFPAAAVGLLLQFQYKTGPFTIPLGALGVLAGFFYATKPIQWAYRGIGEIWIGFAYGWLTIACGFYIQTGQIDPMVHWLALPIAFSIFNVILINEFPDLLADSQVGKKTLLVRLGKERGSKLYCLVNLAAWISYLLSLAAEVAFKAVIFFTPIFALSIVTTFQVLRGDYNDRKKLEQICARTLIFNVATTLSLILAFVL